MKKLLATVLVVVLCGTAGIALAKEGRGNRAEAGKQENREFRGKDRREGRHGKGGGEWQTALNNAPEEIRAKVTELQKLKIDMRDVLSRKPLDRTKAVEIHEKIGTLRQEVGKWFFEQKLDRIEQGQKAIASGDKTP